MGYRVLLVIVFFIFALCLATEIQAEGLYTRDIKLIKDRGKLIVAQYHGTQEGFFAFDDEERHRLLPSLKYEGRRLIGCDIGVAQAAASHLGVALELNRSCPDFDSVIRMVASGKADLGISKLSINLDRAQSVLFSQPYTKVRKGVLVNRLFLARARPNSSIIEVCKRPTTRIGVWGASSYVCFAKTLFPKARLSPYSDLDAALAALVKGNVDAVLDERLELLRWLNQEPRLALKFQFEETHDSSDRIGVAVRPDSPTLLQFVNLLLEDESVKHMIKRSLVAASDPVSATERSFAK